MVEGQAYIRTVCCWATLGLTSQLLLRHSPFVGRNHLEFGNFLGFWMFFTALGVGQQFKRRRCHHGKRGISKGLWQDSSQGLE